MRNRLASIAVAGTLGLTGVAGTALLAPTSSFAADAGTAVTSRVDRITQALSGLVKDGTISQAQADKVATTLDQAMPEGGRGHRGGHRLDLATAAKALGVTPAELRTQLRAGTSLADVAKARGVSQDTLVNALVDARKAQLAASVKAGRITQAHADARAARLTARVTEDITRSGQGGEHGPGGRGHGPDRDDDGPDSTPAPSGTATPSPSGKAAPSVYVS